MEQALSGGDSPPVDESAESSDLQPDTRPISHKQLVVEVKRIYAGLVMVEAKCIDIDQRQSAVLQEKDATKRTNLKNGQWQSIIALHKNLLHGHHDFSLASQHSSASPAMSRLSAKYSMPARTWRHGIHAFLEVLRHRLPESLEHMIAFFHTVYSMMALLYETVSTFEDTWIKYLGDLGRYRMAIEDAEPKDREVWSNVARFWYTKASDKSPNAGRLYHHLAILARSYTLEQLSLYTRSLTCVTPFESARGSIMALFNPILNGKKSAIRRSSSFETLFTKMHSIPADFSDRFDEAMKQLEAGDSYVVKYAARFGETGVFAAVANIAAMFEYGIAKQGVPIPILRLALETFETANHFPSMSRPRMERTLWLGSRFAHTDHSSRVREYAAWMSEYLWKIRVANTSRLGRQIASTSRCIYHAKYFSRVREYATWIPNGLRRKKLSLNSSLLVPFIASFLPVISGVPIGNPDMDDESPSIVPSVPLLVGSLYVGFAAAVLATARFLAAKKGPIRVWSCMMGISAYGWWAVRNDVNASPSLSITDLGVWAISAFHYGIATFQEFSIPERVLLITLLGAAILDMAIVRFMTPGGAPISQTDLLSLSLPAMSLSLAITANLFACFRTQSPSSPPSHETEADISINRGSPNYEGPFHQRPTISHSGTSRLLLLGNPLNDDSTRIWDNDD